MRGLTNEQKANLYNTYLFQYQRIQEQIREIKSNNFELSDVDAKKVEVLEREARRIYNETEKLYR